MRNRFVNLIEEQQIEKHKVYLLKEKDKDGKETEKLVQREIDKFRVGDTVDVHQRILEGAKERTQVYSGVVISRRGEGMRAMFTVRRIVQGEGVERVFLLHSPKIAKVEVKRTGRVRRAKLYYLRDRVGKATRLAERKEKVTVPGDGAAEGKAAKKAKAAEKAAGTS